MKVKDVKKITPIEEDYSPTDPFSRFLDKELTRELKEQAEQQLNEEYDVDMSVEHILGMSEDDPMYDEHVKLLKRTKKNNPRQYRKFLQMK